MEKGFRCEKGLLFSSLPSHRALIIGTLVMILQMDHFYNMPMGFEKEAVVEVPVPLQDKQKTDRLKQLLKQDCQCSICEYV